MTVLLTGGTSGLGRSLALEISRRGLALAVVCRDATRGVQLQRDVARETGVLIHPIVADLATLDGAREAAAGYQKISDRLAVLIHNAGLVSVRRRVTPDGVEEMFAVHHLAPFLMTYLLRRELLAAVPARISIVSSNSHRLARVARGFDVRAEGRFRTMGFYGQSKLAGILFARELSERWRGAGVSVNAIHPGAFRSNLGSHNGGSAALVRRLANRFLPDPAQAAQRVLRLSFAPELESVSGRYFEGEREVEPSAAARDAELRLGLWRLSCELTGVPESWTSNRDLARPVQVGEQA